MKIKGWGQGVNKDQPPWELAPGVCSDCQNMRFRSGNAYRMGGIASQITPSITPYFLLPYSSGATRYAVYMGLTKAYAHDGTSETEITRKTFASAQTVSSASISGGTATIQTSANHGLATGDIVTTINFKIRGSGIKPSTQNALNKANAPITVTDATHFTYSITDTSTGTATTIGSYSIVYSSGGSTNNFTGSIDDKITGGNYNGVAYLNSPVDGFYYWDQTVTGVLHPFADTIITKAYAARSFKNYIFFMGPTSAGTTYRHRLWWSASADPGSVPTSATADPTNDAGFQDLVSDGEMVDGLEWGDVFYVYKRDKRFYARYIGGQYIFDTQLVSGNHKDDGLLAANCIANTPKGQVFLTDGHDIRIHQGGESQSIAFGRVRDWLKSNIDTTYRKRSFLAVNPPFNEVWVCFPETGNSYPSKALVWSWEDDTWGFRSLTNVTFAASGDYPTTIASDGRLLLANTTPKIGLVDSGTTDFGSAYTSMLERTGMDLESSKFKMIVKSQPYFNGADGFTATVYHGAAKTQDASPTYNAGTTYTHNTTRWVQSYSPAGQWLAWKFTTTASDTINLVSVDFDVKAFGDY